MRQVIPNSAVPGKIPPGRKSILRGTGSFVNKKNTRDRWEKPVSVPAFQKEKDRFAPDFPSIRPQ
jgi:hypothetical protein